MTIRTQRHRGTSSHAFQARRRRASHALAWALCGGAALVLGSASPAPAQIRVERNVTAMPVGPGGGGSTRAFVKSDLKQFDKLLKLSEEQHAAAESLLEAYTTESRAASKRTQDALSALREDVDVDNLQEHTRKLTEVFRERETRAAELKTQFLADVKALLTAEQAPGWDELERWDRRRSLLPKGELAGETMDLFRVVEDAGVSEPYPRELADALSSYATDLDAALQARERQRAAHDAGERPNEAIRDMGRIQELMAAHRKLGVPVRDTNTRHARIIAGVVPEPNRAKFEELVKVRTFPRVFKPSHAARSLEAASRFADLDSGQRSGIEQLKRDYERNAAEINERWAAAITQEQKDGGGSAFDFLPGLVGDDDPNPSPVRTLSKERAELDRSTIKQLRESLRKEQVERLPKRQNQMFGGEMPEGEEGGEGGVMIHAITVDGESGGTAETIIISGDGADASPPAPSPSPSAPPSPPPAKD